MPGGQSIYFRERDKHGCSDLEESRALRSPLDFVERSRRSLSMDFYLGFLYSIGLTFLFIDGLYTYVLLEAAVSPAAQLLLSYRRSCYLPFILLCGGLEPRSDVNSCTTFS